MIVIAGPTAVGKTAVAIDVARAWGTEIISADSRQCYREMNIGVARPSADELAQVPHHFIASHSIFDQVSAGVFEQYALEKTHTLLQQYPAVVMVGGTGLYIRAFCEGMDVIPTIDPAIRTQIVDMYAANGLAWLQAQVQEKDPAFWAVAEQQNPQRLMRALEIQAVTGHSILHYRKGNKANRSFRIVKIGLDMDRAVLYERINQRVDRMMEAGLLEEVRALYPHRTLSALQTVGYQELFDHLDGKYSLDEAVDAIKQHTRHYAKRQLTWFKKDESIHWVHALGNDIQESIRKILEQSRI